MLPYATLFLFYVTTLFYLMLPYAIALYVTLCSWYRRYGKVELYV